MTEKPKSAAIRPFILVKDKTYKNDNIVIDGYHFKNCVFIDCTIIWNDTHPYKMTSCQKFGKYSFRTENPVIAKVLLGLKPLWVLEPWFHNGMWAK